MIPTSKTLTIPTEFDIAASPRPIRKREDRIHWVLDALFTKVDQRNPHSKTTGLSRKRIERVVGKKNVSLILSSLITAKVIKRSGQYIVGKQSFRYALAGGYRTPREVPIKKPKFAAKLAGLRKPRKPYAPPDLNAIDLPTRFAIKNLHRIGIDEGDAATAIEQMKFKVRKKTNKVYSKDHFRRQVNKITDHQIYVSRSQYGRMDHNATQLPRAVRACLTFDGERLATIDAVGSQLYILAEASDAMSGTIGGFRKDAIDGIVVQKLSRATGLPPARTKTGTFTFLYGDHKARWNIESPFGAGFKDLYPDDLKCFMKMKEEKCYKDLSRMAQRREASVFIDGAYAKLAEEYWNAISAIPIHDTIMCRERDIATVTSVLQDEYIKRTGACPNLAINRPGRPKEIVPGIMPSATSKVAA